VSVRTATPELVAQRVASVLERRPDADTIALRAEPHWNAGDLLVAGRRVSVSTCISPLAVRSTLADWAMVGSDRARHGGEVLVVLCDLADGELGADVLARFTPSRILGLEPWNAVEQLFGVQRLDAAFRRDDGWIADALLRYVPTETARSMVAGGTLTVDVALAALGHEVLGIDRFDVDSVLSAAAVPSAFANIDDKPEEVVASLLGAFANNNGPLGQLVAAVLQAGHGSELLAISLAARAVYGDGDLDGGSAAGRLEARCANHVIAPTVGAGLASRAEDVVSRLIVTDRDRANEIIAAGSALAGQIQAPAVARSDLLASGFDGRVDDACASLSQLLDQLETGNLAAEAELLDTLRAQIADVDRHLERRSPAGGLRFTHLEMAARLAIWLGSASPATAPQSFEDAAVRFATDGAWIDRARRRLWRGDSDDSVGHVYRRLLDAVVARRRVENKQFAELLASWTATPSTATDLSGHDLVKLEDVLAEVVAPLARSIPVLLVLLDGCGLPSFVEIAPQFAEAGFRELARSGDEQRRLVGIAALPTVTEVSRASLFAGALDRGDQAHERRAFEASTAIAGSPAPRLFHQNSLLGPAGSSLSAALGDALSSNGPAVVGAVVNTIDDQLKRGNFTVSHKLDDLGAVPWLLDAARTHGRVLVVCADHGHVLSQPPDGGSGEYQGGGAGGERWREADRAPGDTEVVLCGTRVLLGGEAGVIAPWDDDFRYSAKAGGYHGGATPEEVLVPVAVFIPAGMEPPKGWDVWSEAPPLWWDLRVAVDLKSTPPPASPKSRSKLTKRVAPDNQPTMFDVPSTETGASDGSTVPAKSSGEPSWLGALLTSEIWKIQRGAIGRTSLPDDRIRNVISALVRRGGVASFAALSADAEVPLVRLAGFLSHLARVLNVDGYVVLDVDAAAQEARLSLPLLGQQFEIAIA
jgi:hypothetical protein